MALSSGSISASLSLSLWSNAKRRIGRAVLTALESNAAIAGYHTVIDDVSRTERLGKRCFWRIGFEPAFSADASQKTRESLLEKKVA